MLLIFRADRQYWGSGEANIEGQNSGKLCVLGLGWVVAGLPHGWQQQMQKWAKIFADLSPRACWDFAGMTSKVLGFFPACESCSPGTSRVFLSLCAGEWQRIPTLSFTGRLSHYWHQYCRDTRNLHLNPFLVGWHSDLLVSLPGKPNYSTSGCFGTNVLKIIHVFQFDYLFC